MRPVSNCRNQTYFVENSKFLLNQNWSNRESGGYIWHTTGSGKPLPVLKPLALRLNLILLIKSFLWSIVKI